MSIDSHLKGNSKYLQRFQWRVKPGFWLWKLFIFAWLSMGSIAASAQESPFSKAEQKLLDDLYQVWQLLGRQPAVDEIDRLGTSSGNDYLRVWNSWGNVWLSLARYLGLKGRIAVLKWDVEQAYELLEHSLQLNPAPVAVRRDFIEAERRCFAAERAGHEATAIYEEVIGLLFQGNESQATQRYQEALRMKDVYRQREVERLIGVYNSAVQAYGQGEYDTAMRLFQELKGVTGRYAGFIEVILPHATEIDRYLSETQDRQARRNLETILRHTLHGRVMLWSNLIYHFGSQRMIFKSLRGANDVGYLMRLPSESCSEVDLGISARILSSLQLGVTWSRTLGGPKHELIRRDEFLADGKINSIRVGDFSYLDYKSKIPLMTSLAFFVESTLLRRRYVRLFLQLGGGSYTFMVPKINILTRTFRGDLSVISTFPGAKETTPGFFTGAGSDFWLIKSNTLIAGLRADAKYLYVGHNTTLNSYQRIPYGGLRIGAGVVVAY